VADFGRCNYARYPKSEKIRKRVCGLVAAFNERASYSEIHTIGRLNAFYDLLGLGISGVIPALENRHNLDTMARKKITPIMPPGPNRHAQILETQLRLYGESSYDAVLARTAGKRAKTGRYMPAGVISALIRMRKDEARLRQTDPDKMREGPHKNCSEPVPE